MHASNICRLCGSNCAPTWFIAWDHEIHACGECGFLFAERLAEAATPNYESDYFNDFVERDAHADTLKRYGDLLKNLEAMAPGRRLFDAGCGAGGFLRFAKSAGWSVDGIDGSQTAVRFAREMHDLDVKVADLEQYLLSPRSFDVVCSFHVIEHLSNPLHLLKNISVALVAGGIAYLGTPLYTRGRIRRHQWLYRIGIANHPYDFNLPDHISYFNERTLSQALSSVGLEVVKTWFTARHTLGEMAAVARRSAGARKAIGTIMLPFNRALQRIGYFQHVNVIARKRTAEPSLETAI
jgi:2-polyprenyl-3-methyl-5-hydroxy-6-metoxy-1,4-benzoquinol methylase